MTTHDPDETTAVDLTPLWPDRGTPDRWASLVARIESAAAPELARRAGRLTRSAAVSVVDGVVAAVARFAVPAFVAAAAAIVIALLSARQIEAPMAATGDVVATAGSLSEETVQQALLGADGAWIAEQRAPDADDLVRSMLDGDPE
ncbi:hypothetical protein J421_5375 (plasmid) [Gemmatirosa kalamazoonensis]|jgi:hypothetical protein|uniref:Uncharacterized protein n=1 Tax=Gemmatirosa kalamazoonensis TaxID=861299 RepID=W0RRG5_9BACT|nr:hypothetical protein [Gemmatirosa kalamazoonensis]AHG92910.1 hypothetical protein J421_5375 [Gemmatirosa kalamazoonensis]